MAASVNSRKKAMSIYMDEKVKNDLTKLAQTQRRSVSNLIEVLCEEYIKREQKE